MILAFHGWPYLWHGCSAVYDVGQAFYLSHPRACVINPIKVLCACLNYYV